MVGVVNAGGGGWGWFGEVVSDGRGEWECAEWRWW